MGGQGETDLVPTDIDIWMMKGILCARGDAIDEPNCGREILELKEAADLVFLTLPR